VAMESLQQCVAMSLVLNSNSVAMESLQQCVAMSLVLNSNSVARVADAV
jgi:hypothetical protein